MKILWELAQKLAKEEFEQEGISSWDEIDKYEREDRVHSMYEKICKDTDGLRTKNLVLVEGEWKMRDSLTANGNNETTNTNSIKRGNDTMKTNKEMRMETLKVNNIDTTNFFDLSMRVPFGAEVKILVNGKEMIIPATTNGNVIKTTANGLARNFGTPTFVASNGDVCDAETGEVLVMANPNSITVNGIVDPIAQGIINDGYVKNSKLFRRFVLAHTFKLLEYVDRKNPNRKGWEAGFKDMYGYGYQFEMLADELHTLAKLQKEDIEYFAERIRFFNGDVVVATLEDYLYRLKKYVKKQMRENPRAYRGQAYVKLARYGNVLVKDLDTKVYAPIQKVIDDIKDTVRAGNYVLIEKKFINFMAKYYNKLPYETPKCAVFKDAYKGIGAFETLKNLIRFHEVVLDGCDNKYDSERELYKILKNTSQKDIWVFHNLLVSTIELNKFNLKQSIANGHAAPNTVSERANTYRR